MCRRKIQYDRCRDIRSKLKRTRKFYNSISFPFVSFAYSLNDLFVNRELFEWNISSAFEFLKSILYQKKYYYLALIVFIVQNVCFADSLFNIFVELVQQPLVFLLIIRTYIHTYLKLKSYLCTEFIFNL